MSRFTKILEKQRNFNVFGEAWEILASPRRAQDGPRWRQDGPRCAQDGSRWRQDGPRLRQDGPKMAIDGSKTVLRRVKMHPSGLKMQRCSDLQKYRVQKRPQDGPKWLQDGPRWLQDVLRMYPRCTKMVHVGNFVGRAQRASERSERSERSDQDEFVWAASEKYFKRCLQVSRRLF